MDKRAVTGQIKNAFEMNKKIEKLYLKCCRTGLLVENKKLLSVIK